MKKDKQTRASNLAKNTGELAVVLGWLQILVTLLFIGIDITNYHNNKISKSTLLAYVALGALVNGTISIIMIIKGRDLKRSDVDVPQAKKDLMWLLAILVVQIIVGAAIANQAAGFLSLILLIMVILTQLAIRRATAS